MLSADVTSAIYHEGGATAGTKDIAVEVAWAT